MNKAYEEKISIVNQSQTGNKLQLKSTEKKNQIFSVIFLVFRTFDSDNIMRLKNRRKDTLTFKVIVQSFQIFRNQHYETL